MHLLNGDWLPWVDGYDIKDDINGYAGIKGKVIDGLQVEFEGVGDYKATYRVRKQGAGFWDWQHNTEKTAHRTVTQVCLTQRSTACRLHLHNGGIKQ